MGASIKQKKIGYQNINYIRKAMKCKDCKDMICRTFYAKEERWVGYCRVKETFTEGDLDCWAIDKTDSGSNSTPF